jgi:hypothetical protein
MGAPVRAPSTVAGALADCRKICRGTSPDAINSSKRCTTPDWRAELEALVDEANESELARLEEAVTVSPDDGLDDFCGPAPDSVTAAEAIVADLTEQFAQYTTSPRTA